MALPKQQPSGVTTSLFSMKNLLRWLLLIACAPLAFAQYNVLRDSNFNLNSSLAVPVGNTLTVSGTVTGSGPMGTTGTLSGGTLSATTGSYSNLTVTTGTISSLTSATASVTALTAMTATVGAQTTTALTNSGEIFTGSLASGIINGSGAILSSNNSSGIGYVSGAGGAVTQITNRSTAVTINTVAGQITTATNSLAALAVATFTVTDSSVLPTDLILLSMEGGATDPKTSVRTATTSTGAFGIAVHNFDASTTETGAITINFAVLKGATN